ncbi:MAG: phosphoesterase [Desulfobulbus propionicus]|nr:MAG: phosphoesterase [Desulfobulbus propionicus]PIE60812.1 MAG: phosphoesterase [Desulfobulbus propionicus]
MCIDLHTHSIYSDGSNTPEELIQLAQGNGITALSLTDHDTMQGVSELVALGKKYHTNIITGVEISARYNSQSLHILGYGINPNNATFTQWLARLQDGREQRNLKILHSLQDFGIDITQEEVDKVSMTGLAGRPHFARLLIEKGVVKTFNDAFRIYLGKGQKAWHSRFCYSAIETIKTIHEAGGIAVLAHPGVIDHEHKRQPAIIRELALYGLDGIEVIYPTHSKKFQKTLLDLAEKHHLLVTGGSDYHGVTRPANRLAGLGGSICPPESLLPAILKKIAEYQ